MIESRFKYRWTDAWLLLSIIYGSGARPATLQDIVAAGDGINHAIFNNEEIESGLYRLTYGKWVTESPSGFVPRENTLAAYNAIRLKNLGPHDERKELEKMLDAEPWNPKEPLPHPDNCFRYSNFSSEELEKAIRQYTKGFWVAYRKLSKNE